MTPLDWLQTAVSSGSVEELQALVVGRGTAVSSGSVEELQSLVVQ